MFAHLKYGLLSMGVMQIYQRRKPQYSTAWMKLRERI